MFIPNAVRREKKKREKEKSGKQEREGDRINRSTVWFFLLLSKVPVTGEGHLFFFPVVGNYKYSYSIFAYKCACGAGEKCWSMFLP